MIVKFCVSNLDGAKFWVVKEPLVASPSLFVVIFSEFKTTWFVSLFFNVQVSGTAPPSTLIIAVPLVSSKHWKPAKTTEAPNA